MDEMTFTGCLVSARLIGVIGAEQTKEGSTTRDDRLIAVACKSLLYDSVKTINDLTETLIVQIKYFFVSYNQAKNKKFKPPGEFGTIEAENLINGRNQTSPSPKKIAGQTRGKEEIIHAQKDKTAVKSSVNLKKA